jgi:8-oxo-dGTP pyrophosphatase MutT (NUDIX family)
MADALTELLRRLVPSARDEVAWFGGAMRLQLEVFVTAEPPPLEYVTSVRAVLFSGGRCAVLSNADGKHVLPGGRREGGESIEAALRREVLEETGCTIQHCQALGFLLFRHLTPKPADYQYPYPLFVQAVFVAEGAPSPDFAGDLDRYEVEIDFVAPADLEQIAFPDYQRRLVEEAAGKLPWRTCAQAHA